MFNIFDFKTAIFSHSIIRKILFLKTPYFIKNMDKLIFSKNCYKRLNIAILCLL